MAAGTISIWIFVYVLLLNIERSWTQQNSTLSANASLTSPVRLPVTPKRDLSSSILLVLAESRHNCKKVYTVSYGYPHMYHWADSLAEKLNRNKNSTQCRSATLRFGVRAFSNAHILLSNTAEPAANEPVYEIVLGAGKNSFSEIRRNRRKGTQFSLRTPLILSSQEIRSFWIRQTYEGYILVGYGNSTLPFMSWQDPQPLSIHYFGFCTWPLVTGIWYYDCPISITQGDDIDSDNCDNPYTITDTSDEEEQPKTMTQKLRKDLLSQYDPFVRPVIDVNRITNVSVYLIPEHIDIDEHNSVINVHGRLQLEWKDDKLVWDPIQYDGISLMNVRRFDVWVPEILLYNAVHGQSDTIIQGDTRINVVIYSNGYVFWNPKVNLQALCSLRMTRWPNDLHTCKLHFGTWYQDNSVEFFVPQEGKRTEDHSIKADGSKWIIENIARGVSTQFDKWKSNIDSEEEYYTSMAWFEVTIRRRSDIYNKLLLTPLATICIQMIASFWVSPREWSRLLLCEVNLLIIILVMVNILFTLPSSSDAVPHIIQLYESGLLVATISLLITILVISLSSHRFQKPPPLIISQQLNGTIGSLLLLPPNSKKRNTYGQESRLSDNTGNEETINTANILSQDREQNDEVEEDQWLRLATAIDRFVCFTYCIFLTVIFIIY